MINIKEEDINGLLYIHPVRGEPTRYEMVRYSTWRIYLFQEFESMAKEKIEALKTKQDQLTEKYPNLVANPEQRQFYNDILREIKNEKTSREDIISHFVCRMLYCRDSNNHSKFVDMEKMILNIRLERIWGKDDSSKKRQVLILKHLLGYFLQMQVQTFDVSPQDWNKYGARITNKNAIMIEQYACVPLAFGQIGLRKRYSFVRGGKVFVNNDTLTEIVLNLYGAFLKNKLEKMRVPLIELLNNDVENQMNGFLTKTLETLNTTNFDETIISPQFKLNIKSIDVLWKRFFPPCMLNLNQKLKLHNHLKHDGRRQLWLFLKGCGMDVTDNQAYFSKHFASKVSVSELKGHMYNIQHAYGLVGKRQTERPKNCRNIITGPAPKKDQHHGCPFSHWRTEDLKEYLRKHYNISQVNLQEVIKQKEENHFQVACGRLFEGVSKSQGIVNIPAEITNLLSKSPHQYFQAGMELVNFNNTKGQDKRDKKPNVAEKKSLQF